MRAILIAGFIACSVSAAAAETCHFEAEQLPPVNIMGTWVQPQSNVVHVGECDKSFDELERDYLARPHGSIRQPGFSADMRCHTGMVGNSVNTSCHVEAQ